MEAIITNKKRTCAVEGLLGNVKVQGTAFLDPEVANVTGYNLIVYFNTAMDNADPSFVYAGSINKDGSFNSNILPEYTQAAESMLNVAFSLIENIELQYA